MDTGIMKEYLVPILVPYILWVAGAWAIFEKADEAGWKALIPIYNVYTLYKLVWSPYAFWLVHLGFIVGGALSLFSDYHMYRAGEILVGLSAIGWIIGKYMLAKAFGKGIMMTINLIIFNPLSMLVIAFGGSSYEGTM